MDIRKYFELDDNTQKIVICRQIIIIGIFIDLHEHIRQMERQKLNDISNDFEKWQNDIKINPKNVEKGNKNDSIN